MDWMGRKGKGKGQVYNDRLNTKKKYKKNTRHRQRQREMQERMVKWRKKHDVKQHKRC